MPFSFEQLTVYAKSLSWVQTAESLIQTNKTHISRSLADQLSRASLSIPLNIAEGNGRWHAADKRQFFWIARGSVFECVPILQVLKSKSILNDTEFTEHYDLLEQLSKMLSGLIKSVDTDRKPT